MSRDTYIVGNWKMNQTLTDIKAFFNYIKDSAAKSSCSCKNNKQHMWIAPQAMHLGACIRLGKELDILIGSQNCADHQVGAYTGELSPMSLKDIGVHFTLVGHSERRKIYGESDELLNSKAMLALQTGLNIIFCVGEQLEDRESGKTNEIVGRQILEGLKNIPDKYRSRVIIAYEPVWAIGTGKNASPEQAQEVHTFIRNELLPQLALNKEDTIILYGGSVKPSNIKELLKQKDIDGALVGGASLHAEDYCNLCVCK